MPSEVQFLDSRARVVADGIVDMLEVPAGSMPPLHVHHTHDEGFYVLDGEVTLFQPGREVTLRDGDYFLAERGVPHTYRVGEDGPARMITTGDGFDRFVAEVAALDAPDPETLGRVAGEHGIEILGAPGQLP